MSNFRRSYIGAGHAARIQRDFAPIGILYALIIGAILWGILAGDKLLGLNGVFSFVVGALVSGWLVHLLGTLWFFLVSIALNTLIIGGVFVLLASSPEVEFHPLMIFTAIGAWGIVNAALSFSNDYFWYLLDQWKHEQDYMYRD